MQDLNRRNFLAITGLGALSVSVLGMTGCASSGGSDGGSSTIRFAWWGGADRQRAYLSSLETFSEENPTITVEPEFGDYTAYQERMTTQMAARDVPDVFWIPSPAVLTYRDAGIYRNLEDIDSLDLSAFSDEEIELYRLDGELNTLPKSVFSPVLRFNKTFLDEDGIALPENLTWDNLTKFLTDYTRNNPHGRKGTSYGAYHDMPFESFLRQRGEDLWTQEGTLGASVDGVAAWIEWWENLRSAGATTTISEQDGIEPGWSDTGGNILVTFANSNHIVDDAAAFPDYEFDQRDMPALEDAAAGYHFAYFSRFAVYSGIDEDKVQAAGELLSFNLNSLDLLKLVGLSSGAPPSSKLLTEYEQFASPDEQKVIALTREIATKDQRARYEAPAGSGSWRTMLTRELEGVTLGQRSISDAATNFVDGVNAAIGTS